LNSTFDQIKKIMADDQNQQELDPNQLNI